MSGLLERVKETLGEAVLDTHDSLGDATLLLAAEGLVESMRALRDEPELRFNVLLDLTAVDYLGRTPRFEVVYHLTSLDPEPHGTEPSRLRRRLRVKVGVPEVPAEIPSVTSLWASANWMQTRGTPRSRSTLPARRFPARCATSPATAPSSNSRKASTE